VTTRTQSLVDTLRARIEDGVLAPGSVVPSEAELVAEFGVSRTVVREAMSRLQAAGLVETQRGRGSFVLARPSAQVFGVSAPASAAERVALFELRLAVETEVASLAAARRGDRELAAVARAAAAFARVADRPADAVRADFAFHLAVAAAARNHWFTDLLGTLGEPMIVMPTARLRAGSTSVLDVVAEHASVVAAIERADPETARAAMRVHLANSIARLGQPPAKGGSTSSVTPAGRVSSGRAATPSTR